MSALVSVTICTADRKIYRFDDLAEAQRFAEASHRQASKSRPTRAKGEVLRCILAALANSADDPDTAMLSALLDLEPCEVRQPLAKAVFDELVEISARLSNNRRKYRITDAGRARLAARPAQPGTGTRPISQLEQLLAWARTAEPRFTSDAAVSGTGITKGWINALLRRAVAEGHVERCGTAPGCGGPRLYRLTAAGREVSP